MTEQSDRLWKLTAEKRAQLLDPATAEFIKHGYEGASLNRILSNAKMSKGQAYYYITGKSDLYLAVCTQSFSDILHDARSKADLLAASDDFWIGVEALAGELAQQFATDKGLSALALSVYESASAVESLSPLTARVDEIIDHIIRVGQNAGQIRTDLPDNLVREMLKALARSIDRWFAFNASSLSPQEFADASRVTFEMIQNFVKTTENGGRNA